MRNILFIFFLINTTFAMQSMEIVRKKSFRNKEKTTVKKSSSFPSTDKSTEINQTIHTEHSFITAIRNKDHNTIKFHLTNPHFNPNIQNAPHLLACSHDYEGIEILLKDPRTDFSQKDFCNKLVSDYIDRYNNNLSELRRKLFARFTLDMITNRICRKLLAFYENDCITPENLNGTIEKIKQTILEDTKNQGDSKLPDEACFPDYAHNEFMIKKIWFTLVIAQKS